MSRISLVTNTGIRNNLRLKTTILILGTVTLICVAGVVLIFCIQLLGPETRTAEPDRSKLEAYLGLVLYVTSVMGIGITLNSYAFQNMVREKARGNLQALLATPLKITDIWFGKSLSVFLPGLVLGTAMAVVALVIINVIYFIPETGFLLNSWMIISSFIAVPLIFLLLSLLVHLVGLTSKTAIGNVIAQMFLPVILTLMINLLVRDLLDASKWLFTVVNLGLAVIIGIVIITIRSRLTPEKIILSG
jgi:ABC-type Na+ efflux pump permease subunit